VDVINAYPLARSPGSRTTPTHDSVSKMNSVDLSDDSSTPNDISPSSNTASFPHTYHPYTAQYHKPLSPSCSPQAENSSVITSISSIISSPLSTRISLRTFTNLVPVSWSQSVPTPSLSTGKNVRVPRGPGQHFLKRNFVSREKQLEKLRNRLEHENPSKLKTSVSVRCSRCDDEVLTL